MKNESNVRQNHQPKVAEVRQTSVATGKGLLTEASTELVTGTPMTDAERLAKLPWCRPNDEVLLLIADAADRYPGLVGEFDSATVRAVVASLHEQRPVAVQAEVLANQLRDQIIAKKSEVGKTCLDFYQAMKGMTRVKEGAVLKPLVKQIGALLKPKKARVAKPAPAAAAPPEGEVKT